MFFGLSEEQVMIRDSFRGTLTRISELEQVRKVAEARAPMDENIWPELCGLGMAGLLIPEEYGGAAFGLMEAALVAEELGRRVTPVPFIATAVMAPLALCLAGSAAQQETWLPRIASGETRFGVAVSETAAGAREDAGVAASEGCMNGRALFVLDGSAADVFIVGDRTGGLHLLPVDADGLNQIPLATIDRTRTITELGFENVTADPLVGSGDALARIIEAGRIMLAADSLGAGEVMLEQAVEYAGQRKQFDRVIGSFQAVKHMCAEMAAELQPCRGLVWYAAHVFDNAPEEAALAALQAKSHVDEVGRFVARTATEVHGGMGFTDLLGLHYWFKRLGVNRAYLGSPERLRNEAAVLQGLA